MNTADLLESIRADIKKNLREELLAELKPEIERRLYANIFTFEEAEQYLKVSESTLRRMVRDREVPYFRQRGHLYFRQIELDRHISRLIEKEANPLSSTSPRS